MTENGPLEPRPSGRRRTVLALVLAVVVVAGALTGFAALRGGEAPPGPLGQPTPGLGPVSGPDDTPLPAVTLPRLNGDGEVNTADYRGTPLVVNFWATWCAPCVEEMPDFQDVATELQGTVAFLGVNVQDNAENARRFAENLEITYELVADRPAAYYAAVRGIGMPTTLFVDADGIVRFRFTGALDETRLRQRLQEHLGVPTPS